MKSFSANKIKNLALVGHGSSGKTTLADALLYNFGQIDRIGRSEEGTLVLDFDAEEKKRKVSISTALYQIERGEQKINLIDVPGQFDFSGSVSEALTAADSVLVVLSGKSGLSAGAKINFEKARKMKKACAFFVGKLDSSRAYFYRVISTLTGQYGAVICPVVVPYSEGETVVSFVDLIKNKAYKFDGIRALETDMPKSEEIENMRSVMIEAVASVDEVLMEKYFDGVELTEGEIRNALRTGLASGEICPVFAGIAQTGEAISLLADILFDVLPDASQAEYKVIKGEAEGMMGCDENQPSAAVIFKTIADPFVGKLSCFKVVSGKITNDMKLVNSRTGKEEKLGKIMWIKGSKQEEATTVLAGDIACVAKLGDVLTGDTLRTASNDIEIVSAEFPKPTLSMAIYPENKGDEEKIATGLFKLSEEDPSIKYFTNNETHELIISGLGEQQMDVVASRLKTKFGVTVKLKSPKVAYRETIRKKSKVQGRYKKQSGGHGKFGDVWIEFEPCDSQELVFEEKIFGGAVPKNFFPAVEKGLRDSVSKGPLAGYPVVGVKAVLVDGSYHPVDSSEMSFKTAAALAFKEGIPQASPVLLEPIGTLKVVIPGDLMGDVIGDINKRRGRVLGMNPADDGMQEIVSEVPISEMSDFSTAMKSIAGGFARFSFDFERYEEAPAMISEKVIAEAKAE